MDEETQGLAQDAHASGMRSAKPPAPRLSVVGLGASAGGLAALSTFFTALPADTGMAFVVVVHLSPEHESILADLLQPHTQMPVTQVTETVEMLPDHVYVIPPGKRLLVRQDRLELAEWEMPRGERLQIDIFFRSLAEHHGDGAAILLSGTGSDGAIGIQSIKEGGGLILVQDPAEAEYDGMPKSAIATGLVDFTGPVVALAAQLVAAKRTRAALTLPSDARELTTAAEQTLSGILAHLHMHTGHDFSGYKRSTILRRISRRMQLTGMETLSAYLAHLNGDTNEGNALYRDILIHVTEFFRDHEAWEALARTVIPVLFKGKGRDDYVRVWTVGCATGEEAYGLTMLLLEQAATVEHPPHLQVFASDLGEPALDFARKGVYPEAIAANVSPERLARFFIEENSHYRVRDELREIVLFTPHNLLRDPPFSKLDLILCRNLLIYLQRPLQERAFKAFHYALHHDQTGGYLFLGSAESPEGISDLFEAVDKGHRIYRRRSGQGAYGGGDLGLPSLPLRMYDERRRPAPAATSESPSPSSVDTHRRLLEETGPPSLLVDAGYRVRHVSETAGRYLQTPGGELSDEVLRLVRPELQSELRAALFRALEIGKTNLTRPVPVPLDGVPHPVALLVRPDHREGVSAHAVVFFLEDETPLIEDGPPETVETASLGQMQAELGQAQQQLQALREEHETKVEELHAANEELQSTNEEYRATLEELETSKEEMQSINEELQTVNQELKNRVEEITRTRNDLQNLFVATEIATLFLDRELRIQRYTPAAGELFNLMPSDLERPIGHLRSNLVYEHLEADARRVLRNLAPVVSREVQQQTPGDAVGWFQVNVRPYRTQNDRIDGVVITFVDITRNKENELALAEAKAYAESIVDTIPDALLVLETDLRVRSANETFYDLFAADRAATEGKLLFSLGNGQWDIPELRSLLEDILPQNKVFMNYEVTHEFEAIGRRTMLLNGQRLDHVQQILLAITDITKRKQAEEALSRSEEKYRSLFESMDEGFCIVEVLFAPDGRPTDYRFLETNPAFDQQLGLPDAEGRRMPEPASHNEDHWYEMCGQVALTGEPAQFTYEAKHLDGRWFDVYAFRIGRPEEHRVAVLFNDVTAQKQQQEQLEVQVAERTAQVRSLVTQLTMSEQAERRRISQILHDDLQQRLHGAQFQLMSLRNAVEGAVGEDALGQFDNIDATLVAAVRQTRTLSIDLSPPVLHNEGLAEAVRWLAGQMERDHGLSVTIEAADDVPVPGDDLRVLLFQIVRELLFNVVKHAGVPEVAVALSRVDEQIQIEVVDQGEGFDVGVVLGDLLQSHGLDQAQRRLGLVGGTLQVESGPGEGTHIIIECPLSAGAE